MDLAIEIFCKFRNYVSKLEPPPPLGPPAENQVVLVSKNKSLSVGNLFCFSQTKVTEFGNQEHLVSSKFWHSSRIQNSRGLQSWNHISSTQLSQLPGGALPLLIGELIDVSGTKQSPTTLILEIDWQPMQLSLVLTFVVMSKLKQLVSETESF